MKFFTNNTDTVVAILETAKGVSYRGEAKCAPGDKFDYEKGVKISALRARMRRNKGQQMGYRKTIDSLEEQIRNLTQYRDQFSGRIKRLERQNDYYKRVIEKITGPRS